MLYDQVDEEDDDGDEVKREKQLEKVLKESKTEKGVEKMPTGKVRRSPRDFGVLSVCKVFCHESWEGGGCTPSRQEEAFESISQF